MLMSEGELAAREDGADTMIETSYGRVVFNRILPSDFDFVNEHMDKKALSRLVLKIVRSMGLRGRASILMRSSVLVFRIPPCLRLRGG